jgi:hypothetical protein
MTSLESKKVETIGEQSSGLRGWIVLLLILIVLAVTNPNEDDFANYAIKQSSDSSFEGFLNELGGSVFKAITSSNDYVFFTVFTVNAVFEQKKYLGIGKVIFVPIR